VKRTGEIRQLRIGVKEYFSPVHFSTNKIFLISLQTIDMQFLQIEKQLNPVTEN